MNFNQEEIEGTQIVHIEGKIMGGPEEKDILALKEQFVENGQTHVVYDLQKLDWINSVGLGLLIGTLTSLRNKGGDLRLANVPVNVYSLMEKCRITTIFKFYDSIDKAVASYK